MPDMQYAWLIWCAAAYLCGSVSFALILGRLRSVDIRQQGSGNVGATNVGRVLGKKWGILCFLLDVLKGTGPTLAAGFALGFIDESPLTQPHAWQWMAVGASTMIGHIYPIWLGFRGGKGVATALGVLLGVWPYLTTPGLSSLVTWIVVAGTFRYVGLASALAVLSLPGYLWFWATMQSRPLDQLTPFFIVTSAMALMILVRHRGNLIRTWRGVEPKLGADTPMPADALSATGSPASVDRSPDQSCDCDT